MKMKRKFEHYFLYIPRGILLWIQGNVAYAGGFCFGQKGLKHKPITICIFIVAPTMQLKKMWGKEKTQLV